MGDGEAMHHSSRRMELARGANSMLRRAWCIASRSRPPRPARRRAFVDHGMGFLWTAHRDAKHGGYFWVVDERAEGRHQAGLWPCLRAARAASSAKVVGHPAGRPPARRRHRGARRPVSGRSGTARSPRSSPRDWSPIADYRGQNSNMHLTEALMAAFEATGDRDYLDKAERIADLVIGQHAAARTAGGWPSISMPRTGARHATTPATTMFRPSGTTPGHWLEWARLLLQLWVLGGRASSTGCPRRPRAVPAGDRPGLGPERRLLLHPRLGRTSRGSAQALVALLPRPSAPRAFLNALARRSATRVVPTNLGLSPTAPHRPSPTAAGTPSSTEDLDAGRPPVHRQARPLPRAAGLPHPALPATGSLTRGLSQGVLSLESETLGNPE